MKKRVGTAFGASLLLPVVAVAIWMLRPFEEASRWVALGVYACGWGCLLFAVQRHRKTLERVERKRLALRAWLSENGRYVASGLGMVAAAWAFVVLVPPTPSELSREPPEDLGARLARDFESLERSRRGLDGALEREGAVWSNAAAHTNADEKAALIASWIAYLDHAIELDRLVNTHSHFYQIDPIRHLGLNVRSFLVGYAALATQVLAAERLRAAVGGKREIETLLDEPRPELGVPKAAYFRLKQRLSGPDTWLRLHAGRGHLELVKAFGKYSERERSIAERAIADYVEIARRLGKRPDILVDNPLDFFERTVFTAWYPLQKHVSEAMGDTRTTGRAALIRPEQIEAIRAQLEPGDILIERRNWYLSNIGLPGFWPHAALFLGTPSEVDAYFRSDDGGASLDAPSARVASVSQAAAAAWRSPDAHGDPPRVLEAISEGVAFTSLEHSAAADYLAVLRPRLSRPAKLAALLRAVTLFGRPYDFDFDFVTDHAIVCSELVYKAFQAPGGEPGLAFDLVRTAGRWVLPPNDIVRKFDQDFGRPSAAFDFVLFLDGSERSRTAAPADAAAVRSSWGRPKWDLLQP